MGGIGFTMSIFIAELGFTCSAEDLLMAKTGVLLLQFWLGFRVLFGYILPPEKIMNEDSFKGTVAD